MEESSLPTKSFCDRLFYWSAKVERNCEEKDEKNFELHILADINMASSVFYISLLSLQSRPKGSGRNFPSVLLDKEAKKVANGAKYEGTDTGPETGPVKPLKPIFYKRESISERKVSKVVDFFTI